MRKPSPEIFNRALAAAGVTAGQAVFIDDLNRNVDAARSIGVRAIKYCGVNKLERELKRLNICVD